MLERPVLFALVVFVIVLVVGIVVLFAADAFPATARTPFERGQVAGKLIAVPALLAAAGAWFYARHRQGRP